MDQNTSSMPIIDARKYIAKKYSRVLAVIVVIAVFLEILIIWGNAYQAIFIPIIILFAFYASIRQKAEDSFFEQFALNNSFSFQNRELPLNLNGSLFSVGHSPIGRDSVSGSFQGISFNLFNYQYTVGSGKNSHNYVYTTFRLDFPAPLPPIFLKPKYCVFGGCFLGGISGEDKKKLTLEGDFNQYFDLWTKEGFEIEALQFLTPDVMENIQNNWQKFSLEFIESQIYIYSSHMIMRDEELENMYRFAEYLVPKMALFVKETKGDINNLNRYYENAV